MSVFLRRLRKKQAEKSAPEEETIMTKLYSLGMATLLILVFGTLLKADTESSETNPVLSGVAPISGPPLSVTPGGVFFYAADGVARFELEDSFDIDFISLPVSIGLPLHGVELSAQQAWRDAEFNPGAS